ncbi:MAG: hypothetical protein HRU34_07570 [Richelia sp.]|nr:hypothetical protein [Richelia sp.]
MNHRNWANGIQHLLLRDDLAIYRQLFIFLLLCLSLGLIFIGRKQFTPQTQTRTNCSYFTDDSADFLTPPKTPINIAEVIVGSGITRTAPNEEADRLTPLPKGTKAAIKAIKGDWLHLDYGAWIHNQEMRTFTSNTCQKKNL